MSPCFSDAPVWTPGLPLSGHFTRREAWLSALLVGLLLLCAGCGFQLRGSVEVPAEYNPLYVQSASDSLVRLAIKDLLVGSKVRLTEDRSEARLILRILSEQRSSRVAAVDANGKTLAYELHYVVRFDALDASGQQRVPPQTMDLLRNFDNADVEVLGKQLEEEMIYEDFATDAADRILMRLRAVLVPVGGDGGQ
ncbi:LPS assembly lipoprotein LptE [Thiorhodococcus mannitoliphagus]|uniref:LPS-assembly lipoprotein LptE n=1 Tax=Thiorhodococcus mannitoliphagus TaxID=329406 RepID=UPI0030B87020